MSTSSRVEELQQKFDQNPRRYFAPLANELRKIGDLAQAIAICRAHLPTQPGHVSGHIVLAQALYEAGELDDARSEFAVAVELDPENLIALRYMGDIAQATGDIAEATGWYQRVLDADPRNYEIARLLKELESLPNDSAVAETPSAEVSLEDADAAQDSMPVVESATPHAEQHSSDVPTALEDHQPSAAAQPPSERDIPKSSDEPEHKSFSPETDDAFFTAGDAADAFAAELSASASQKPDPDEPAIDPSELDALWEEETPPASQHSDYEAAPEQWFEESAAASDEESEAPGVADAGYRRGPTPTLEIEALFDSSEVAGHVDQQHAADAQEQTGTERDDVDAAFVDSPPVRAHESPTDDRSSSGPPPHQDAARTDEEMVATPLNAASVDAPTGQAEAGHDSGAYGGPADAREELATAPDPRVGRTPSFTTTIPESTPFVTETLAELYLQQGFTSEALSIYRQLLARNPSDDTLRNRITALEGGRDVEAAAPQPAAHPIANEKAAQSVRTFFGRLARRVPGGRAAAAPEPPREGEGKGPGLFNGTASEADTRAARNLSSAFSSDSSPAGAKPSRPAERDLSLDHLFREAPPPDAGPVSIDEFYAPTESVPAAPPGGEAAGDDRAADIQQFTSWLEGLKKK